MRMMGHRRWKKHYSKLSTTIDRRDYLKQVGHTVQGESIEQLQFRSMVLQIVELLDLRSDDVLLDLCCGNGLFTKALASQCEKVVGLDFSEPLLQIAKDDHSADSIEYHLWDVVELERFDRLNGKGFTKVLMYGALQHFNESDLVKLLEDILRISQDGRVILFGFVPDRSMKWEFYDTFQRRARYLLQRVANRDRLGTWWTRQSIERTCRGLGLTCSFFGMPLELPAHTYRFNARIE